MFSLFLLAVVATFFAETKQDPRRRRWTGTFGPVYLCYEGHRVPSDCQDWLAKNASLRDGPYSSCPRGYHSVLAVDHQCDMNGGGWIIVLKRFNGSVDFSQTWDQMKDRFGDIDGEHWLGLEDIHRFTTSGNYSMMVEIRKGPRTWTEIYDSFTLSGEAENYTFRAEGFDSTNSNNADSALGWHNYLPFSTRDIDNTGHPYNGICTSAWEGPNWFNGGCGAHIHPFGPYPQSGSDEWPRMKWRVNGRDIKPTELTWKIKRRET